MSTLFAHFKFHGIEFHNVAGDTENVIVVMFIDSSDKYDIQIKHNNTI